MATEPTLALQEAILAALKANSAVAAICGDHIFDRIPGDPNKPPPPDLFPYVRIGEDQDVPDLAECIDGSEIFATVDVFSRAYGKPECKRLAGAVKRCLHAADLTLDDNRLLLIEHNGTVFTTDPDGLTERAIITFRALTEPT